MGSRVEMAHAAHFICGDKCAFKRATVVNQKFIVSTVGEFQPNVVKKGLSQQLRARNDLDPIEPLGASPKHLYETMVFKARKSSLKCCPFKMMNGHSLETEQYASAKAAALGHEKLVKKWSRVRR